MAKRHKGGLKEHVKKFAKTKKHHTRKGGKRHRKG